MKKSLPVGWQYVFPSPVYPSLQEHLNEPSVFEHDARLWRQSCDPCAHSSTSKNDKENRLLAAKIPRKITCDETQEKALKLDKQRKWPFAITRAVCLFCLLVCLSCLGAPKYGQPINGTFINGKRERERKRDQIGSTESQTIVKNWSANLNQISKLAFFF